MRNREMSRICSPECLSSRDCLGPCPQERTNLLIEIQYPILMSRGKTALCILQPRMCSPQQGQSQFVPQNTSDYDVPTFPSRDSPAPGVRSESFWNAGTRCHPSLLWRPKIGHNRTVSSFPLRVKFRMVSSSLAV